MHHSWCVEIRGQFLRVSSLLLPHRSQKYNQVGRHDSQYLYPRSHLASPDNFMRMKNSLVWLGPSWFLFVCLVWLFCQTCHWTLPYIYTTCYTYSPQLSFISFWLPAAPLLLTSPYSISTCFCFVLRPNTSDPDLLCHIASSLEACGITNC